MSEPTLLQVEDLSKSFATRRSLLGKPLTTVYAVNGVSLSIPRGATLGLVGESGSGKSTVGRLIAQLITADTGRVMFEDRDLTKMKGAVLRAARRDIQVVFQDPFSSLDPSWMVTNIVTEGLRNQGMRSRTDRENEAVRLLEMVGLKADHARRYPYEFSGGQRQRIAIARALATDPKLVICDEAVSALDVSTQASILLTLQELQERLGLSYLFISHDLSVVRQVSQRIAVMYLGRIAEEGSADQLYTDPRHPYTRALLSAIPEIGPRRRERIRLVGDLPNPTSPPKGCVFHPRCEHAMSICAEVVPTVEPTGHGWVACHLHNSIEVTTPH